MSDIIPRVSLDSHYTISQIIKGSWQLAGGHGPVNLDEALTDMRSFVEAGITTFDCADIYTGVEVILGKFIAKYRDSFKNGTLPPVQIHTKFVPDLDVLPKISRSYVENIIDRSLIRLGLERLDMVQFHWWDYSINRYIEVVQHLAEIQKQGKIHALGVTNFDAKHLKEIIDTGINIITNQVQYSVLDHRPEEDLSDLCQSHGIKLLCYGTVAGGFLNNSYLGIRDIKDIDENRSLIKYKLIIDEFGGPVIFQNLLHQLHKIASKYEVGIADIAIKYIIQKPCVAAAIVGARNTSHLNNLQKLNSFTLKQGDLKLIKDALTPSKGPRGAVYDLERDRQGKHGRIMKYNLNRT
jgi:aryl-alcohol dehydrogenase-like predicted oxidoreductase